MRTIRILSDLHFLEGSCRVRNIAQIRPLLDGADELIFNGDLIDTQHVDPTLKITEELKSFFCEQAPTTFITGNHDPNISDTHELQLAGETVWVTHGDIVFDDMIPWSRARPKIAQLINDAVSQLPATERDNLARRFAIYREIARDLPRELNLMERSARSLLARYFYVLFPPTQAFALLHSWKKMPQHAARTAKRHRPKTRFVINGHSHLAGIWKADQDTTVINTGSFCGPFSGTAVDIVATSLRVRPISLRNGEFRLEAPAKTFSLPVSISKNLSPTT